MIARVMFVWLAFSVTLLVIGLFSQGEDFEFSQLALSFALSLPVAVSVLRGGLGESSSVKLQYPSLSLMVVSAWILIVGPSLIIESDAARFMYRYSDAALTLARVFFFGWCLLFVVAAGRPRLNELNARPTMFDFIACTAVVLLIAGFLLRAGLFSNYQSSRVRSLPVPGAGTTESTVAVLGATLFTLVPALLFLMLVRVQSRVSHTFIVFMGFLASWALLFLLGSRTGVSVAIASCLLMCRGLGMRLRANVLIGLGVALPAALVLIMVYRDALSASEGGAASVGHLLTIASDATSSLNEQDAQSDALDLVSNNVRVRLWYGQQFCVVIDQWLDEGAALRGTIFAGVISSIPTLLMSDKNMLAADLNFEAAIIQSQRFPEIDLAPTPWMQWLYELGIMGLVIGALIYAWLARMIEHRVSKTGSFYEILFWLGLFIGMLAPEHTTDSLVLSARVLLIHMLVIGVAARTLTWLATLGRRQHAT
jgi:hypothetical protein